MVRKSGFTLIEMLVVMGIIAMLAAMLFPIFTIIRNRVKESNTGILMSNIRMALEQYANDFSGYYPPDTLDASPLMVNGGALENSSQCLCYYVESEFISDDGRPMKPYLTYEPRRKRFKGDNVYSEVVDYTAPPVRGVISFDYIVDYFGTPILYDERRSEGDLDGLNRQSFILISGGAHDKNRNVNLDDFDAVGDNSMFNAIEGSRIDTRRSDYRDQIPSRRSDNDDIIR
ncbi:type II secretion system protein [Planctomycetota bacterium]